jgi:hypothetical protein
MKDDIGHILMKNDLLRIYNENNNQLDKLMAIIIARRIMLITKYNNEIMQIIKKIKLKISQTYIKYNSTLLGKYKYFNISYKENNHLVERLMQMEQINNSINEICRDDITIFEAINIGETQIRNMGFKDENSMIAYINEEFNFTKSEPASNKLMIRLNTILNNMAVITEDDIKIINDLYNDLSTNNNFIDHIENIKFDLDIHMIDLDEFDSDVALSKINKKHNINGLPKGDDIKNEIESLVVLSNSGNVENRVVLEEGFKNLIPRINDFKKQYTNELSKLLKLCEAKKIKFEEINNDYMLWTKSVDEKIELFVREYCEKITLNRTNLIKFSLLLAWAHQDQRVQPSAHSALYRNFKFSGDIHIGRIWEKDKTGDIFRLLIESPIASL